MSGNLNGPQPGLGAAVPVTVTVALEREQAQTAAVDMVAIFIEMSKGS